MKTQKNQNTPDPDDTTDLRVRIDGELRTALERIAEEEMHSLSVLAKKILRDYCRRHPLGINPPPTSHLEQIWEGYTAPKAAEDATPYQSSASQKNTARTAPTSTPSTTRKPAP